VKIIQLVYGQFFSQLTFFLKDNYKLTGIFCTGYNYTMYVFSWFRMLFFCLYFSMLMFYVWIDKTSSCNLKTGGINCFLGFYSCYDSVSIEHNHDVVMDTKKE
jgi:hypothetical protein